MVFKGKRKSKVAPNVKKYVKRVLDNQVEDKFRLISNDNVTTRYSGPPDNLSLSALSRGVASNQRVGDRVKYKSVEVWITAVPRPTVSTRLRILLFIDKQSNLDVPLFPINYFVSIGAFDSNTCITPLNPNFFPARYKLLYDGIKTLDISGGATDIPRTHVFKIKKNLKGITEQFKQDVSGETTAAIIKNQLILYMISDQGAAENAPGVTVRTILNFEDA